MYNKVGYDWYCSDVPITLLPKLSWIKSHSRDHHMNGKVLTHWNSYYKVTSISAATGKRFEDWLTVGRPTWVPLAPSIYLPAKSGPPILGMHAIETKILLRSYTARVAETRELFLLCRLDLSRYYLLSTEWIFARKDGIQIYYTPDALIPNTSTLNIPTTNTLTHTSHTRAQ